MKATASTNIFSTFFHIIFCFAQVPFFNKCQKEKCVLKDVTFTGRKAGEMRKVTAQVLLSLVLSTILVRVND
jgi:predicted KAP-like P-loop ATPase